MKIKSTVNFKNKTTLLLSWTKMKIQFKVKYKVNCKWNSKCKWKWISPWPSATTIIMLRALTSNRADHVLACNMAEWRQFANKQRQKRATKGKRPARESVEAKDEIIAEDEFRSHWKTAKVHQDWAKRIFPIRIRWYNFRQHSRILPEVLYCPNR